MLRYYVKCVKACNTIQYRNCFLGTNPNLTTVTVSQSSRVFNESDGTVTILIQRKGNLEIASVVM